ncbi:MAG: hypothetical protein IT317_08425 [Anaerolineales bacterium]|nr:hypothetical protein [Anaerolineales bacterium]
MPAAFSQCAGEHADRLRALQIAALDALKNLVRTWVSARLPPAAPMGRPTA